MMLALLLAADALTAPIHCTHCAEWNRPQRPFRVVGNTFYVGVEGLASILVTSPQGHVLLDGALPQSAPLIERNVRALGFRLEDIKVIVLSHAHFDHAGGIAAIQRDSGAEVAASPANAKALAEGRVAPDDPLAADESSAHFPRAARVRALADGEAVQVGPLRVIAHFTPGHTPGSTTWTWRSCERERCFDVVYADSLNAISEGDFKFAPIADSFRASIDRVASLPCDVLLTVHPDFARLREKLNAGASFAGSGECRNYATDARRRLEKRLASESTTR
ncbi:MAG TPA: subclass B3 metallo-beta-lactamase [Myxococcales bacterium]|nr:subclass B3 metallo-beta-lactamase [Myxococcales bacterium]